MQISRARKLEIENLHTFDACRKKVKDIALLDKQSPSLFAHEEDFTPYDLPF